MRSSLCVSSQPSTSSRAPSSLRGTLAPARPAARPRNAQAFPGHATGPRFRATDCLVVRAQVSVATSFDPLEVDQLLKEADESKAVAYIRAARLAGQCRGFGNARLVPKRQYGLDELRLNKIESEKVISPSDKTLDKVRGRLQLFGLAGLLALVANSGWNIVVAVYSAAIVTFVITYDQVAFRGGLSSLLLDSAGRIPFLGGSYASRVSLHEAGHFLIAYLMGILPKAYTLSTLDAFTKYRTLAIQAGTTFCDQEFQAEVQGGKLKASSLDVYSCVALAGVATEYIRFGAAEGGLNDIQNFDRLLQALGFTEKKAKSQVRWALLNTVALLRRHAAVHDVLAKEMAAGASVGRCIQVIESALAGSADLLTAEEAAEAEEARAGRGAGAEAPVERTESPEGA